jgi:dihydroxyacetone kinase-like protein
MEYFRNADGKAILLAMVKTIQENKDYLGDLDGRIGDGDHGMNMNKGFTMFSDRIAEREIGFSDGLSELGMILLNEIGGSMGPIYGTIFMEIADAIEGRDAVDLNVFADAIDRGYRGLQDIVEAQVGDKTIVDTLAPLRDTLQNDVSAGRSFNDSMDDVVMAAKTGSESTVDMIAKLGRASRLGERSKGTPDAGAVSCALIFTAMAKSVKSILQ